MRSGGSHTPLFSSIRASRELIHVSSKYRAAHSAYVRYEVCAASVLELSAVSHRAQSERGGLLGL